MPRRAHPAVPLGPFLAIAGLAATMVLERRAPLRSRTQAGPARVASNLLLGVMSMAVVAAAEGPLVAQLARVVERRRWGLAQRVGGPAWLRDALAVLGMDYTMYVWHVLTHKMPLLWRFHLVHHVDLDLDSSTALRFHAVDMLISIPWRAAQIVVFGTSRRALSVWQTFFFASVVFHHSNIRLPFGLERRLATVLTTPRMHGIHHSAVRDQTDSNWSSGLSVWDRMHRTFRLDVPQRQIRIGVPGYRDAAALRILSALRLPFRRQRDAWQEQSMGPVPSLGGE